MLTIMHGGGAGGGNQIFIGISIKNIRMLSRYNVVRNILNYHYHNYIYLNIN